MCFMSGHQEWPEKSNNRLSFHPQTGLSQEENNYSLWEAEIKSRNWLSCYFPAQPSALLPKSWLLRPHPPCQVSPSHWGGSHKLQGHPLSPTLPLQQSTTLKKPTVRDTGTGDVERCSVWEGVAPGAGCFAFVLKVNTVSQGMKEKLPSATWTGIEVWQKEELWEVGLGQEFQGERQRQGMLQWALKTSTTYSPHIPVAFQHASVHTCKPLSCHCHRAHISW